MAEKFKVKLLDQSDKLFDEIHITKPVFLGSGPEAILFNDRVWLPTKKADTFRECKFVFVPLPPI